MRKQPSGTLVCPVPECRAPFTVPIQNSRGTRFLRDRSGTCTHASARPDTGGGPVSARHRWLEARLARICQRIGHQAICEDFTSHADVYVPDGRLCIEVQLRPTNFRKRTVARQSAGHGVLWLLPDDVRGRGVDDALFRLPAARLLVHERGNRRRPLEPWVRPEEAARAVLSVYATVASLAPDGTRLITRHHDAAEFLREVISGERRWYRPGTSRLPQVNAGAWVRVVDLRTAQSEQVDEKHPPGPAAVHWPTASPEIHTTAEQHSSAGVLNGQVLSQEMPLLSGVAQQDPPVSSDVQEDGDVRGAVASDVPATSPSAPGPRRSRWRALVEWYFKGA